MCKDLEGKRLLVLGGSAWLSMIRAFAEEHHICLIGAGNDPSSPLASLDEYYEINSTDNEAMKRLILEKHIDGVYLGSHETVIRHATQYVNELGLPCYCTADQWDILTNKRKLKELWQKFDIPVAKAYSYSKGKPCDIPFPVIVKPEDGCGSVGITICHEEEELDDAIDFARKNSPSGQALIEQLVNPSGVEAFLYLDDGDMKWCALSDKYPVRLQEGAGAICGARTFPGKYTDEFRALFEEKIKRAFRSIGLHQGLIWMEVFHDAGKYYFNEVGYRPNGSLSIVGIDYLCHINTVAADINYALAGGANEFSSLVLKDVPREKKKVCEYWVASKPGEIGYIGGVEKLMDHPNVLAVFPKYSVGDIVPHTNGFAQNFCVVHFAYDTAEEMREGLAYIRQVIQLKDPSGADMIIHKSEAFIEQLIKENE